jgi:hypothetical protein
MAERTREKRTWRSFGKKSSQIPSFWPFAYSVHPYSQGFTLLEEEHLRTPEADLSLLGIVWWNTANKSLHGMECQNLLPYTCDVQRATAARSNWHFNT